MFALNRSGSVCGLSVSALAVGTLLFASGCQQNATSDSSGKTLYERLGGHEAINAVVDDFVSKAASDPSVNFTRKGHPNTWEATPENIAHLEKELVLFVEANTGGPQKYNGGDMLTVHKGMQISEDEWNAIVADLKAALVDFNVSAKDQSDLIKIVATTHDAIVGH